SIFHFTTTSTTDIYTLSLHDALPIFKNINVDNSRTLIFSRTNVLITQTITSLTLLVIVDFILINEGRVRLTYYEVKKGEIATFQDRKSTRLNSSHGSISYAVFCLKKK